MCNTMRIYLFQFQIINSSWMHFSSLDVSVNIPQSHLMLKSLRWLFMTQNRFFRIIITYCSNWTTLMTANPTSYLRQYRECYLNFNRIFPGGDAQRTHTHLSCNQPIRTSQVFWATDLCLYPVLIRRC